MNGLKRFWSWLKSPKSNFALLVVLLILANLVGSKAFFRADLTSTHSYSLSDASVSVVKTIEQPLSIKVFFTENLPSPYNTVEQYLSDLLVEYKGNSNKNFSYEFFDMTKPENETLARNYGLQQLQIQEIKNNEVGFKNAYMGLAVLYGDRIEILDNLTSSDGLEYKMTMTISKMISTTDLLSGLDGNVKMTLYSTGKLSMFGISGFDKLESSVQEAYEDLNKKNMGKITFESVDPSQSEIDSLVAQYGIQKINWTENDAAGTQSSGVLGIVLEYDGQSRTVPLNLGRSIFGYAVSGLNELPETLSSSLQSLVSKTLTVGYITGHDERSLEDEQNGSARFKALTSDMYELKELNLAEVDIPAEINTIVISGPKKAYSDTELYKIDQFVLRGGNLMLFLDPYEEIQTEASYYGYGMPTYQPIDTGLERLLEKYGLTVGKNYVLDEECYTTQQQGYGTINLYYVPVLKKNFLNQKHEISKNLSFVLFCQNSSIDINFDKTDSSRSATVLAQSSPSSWLMSEDITLSPLMMSPPDESEMASQNMAVIVEGVFDSAFETSPIDEATSNSETADGSDSVNTTDNVVVESTHLSHSLQKSKIFVVGSSIPTNSMLLDETQSQPISLFIRNAVDYMTGNGDMNEMRTKSVDLNTLTIKNSKAAKVAQIFNQYIIPLLVALSGLLVWRLRVARRRLIAKKYQEAK